MVSVIINPGTGPVVGATRANADRNMRALRRDVGVTFHWARKGAIEQGRYPYLVWILDKAKKASCTVDMPGLPLERVRYLGLDGQNIWHFPRLYVDGSSWVWEFAVDCVRDALGLPDVEVAP